MGSVISNEESSVSMVVVDGVGVSFGAVVGLISGNFRVWDSGGLLGVGSPNVGLPDLLLLFFFNSAFFFVVDVGYYVRYMDLVFITV